MSRPGVARRKSRKAGETWVATKDARGEPKVRCRFCEAALDAKDWWFHTCPRGEEKK